MHQRLKGCVLHDKNIVAMLLLLKKFTHSCKWIVFYDKFSLSLYQ